MFIQNKLKMSNIDIGAKSTPLDNLPKDLDRDIHDPIAKISAKDKMAFADGEALAEGATGKS